MEARRGVGQKRLKLSRTRRQRGSSSQSPVKELSVPITRVSESAQVGVAKSPVKSVSVATTPTATYCSTAVHSQLILDDKASQEEEEEEFKIPRKRLKRGPGRTAITEPLQCIEQEQLQLALALSASLDQETHPLPPPTIKTRGTRRSKRLLDAPPPLLTTTTPEKRKRLALRLEKMLTCEKVEVSCRLSVFDTANSLAESNNVVSEDENRGVPLIRHTEDGNRGLPSTDHPGDSSTKQLIKEGVVSSPLDQPIDISPVNNKLPVDDNSTDSKEIIPDNVSVNTVPALTNVPVTSVPVSSPPVSAAFAVIVSNTDPVTSVPVSAVPVAVYTASAVTVSNTDPVTSVPVSIVPVSSVSPTPLNTHSLLCQSTISGTASFNQSCSSYKTLWALSAAGPDEPTDQFYVPALREYIPVPEVDDQKKRCSICHTDPCLTTLKPHPLAHNKEEHKTEPTSSSATTILTPSLSSSSSSAVGRLKSDFNRLLATGSYSDVNILVANDRIILAHAAILTSRCPSLARMLSTCSAENLQIDLASFSFEVVSMFLTFLYTADVSRDNMSVENRAQLLTLSQIWDVPDLAHLLQGNDTPTSPVRQSEDIPPAADRSPSLPRSSPLITSAMSPPVLVSDDADSLLLHHSPYFPSSPDPLVQTVDDVTQQATTTTAGQSLVLRETDEGAVVRDISISTDETQLATDVSTVAIDQSLRETDVLSLPIEGAISTNVDCCSDVSTTLLSPALGEASQCISEQRDILQEDIPSDIPVSNIPQFTSSSVQPISNVSSVAVASVKNTKVSTCQPLTRALVDTPGGCGRGVEFVTPQGLRRLDVLQSDDNITPMPDYKNMATPCLKNACSQYGVRVLTKRKMIALLEEIYNYQHPLVDEHGAIVDGELRVNEPVKGTKKRKEQEKEPEVTVREAIVNDTELYQDILLYKPLELVYIQSRLKSQGVTIAREKLMDILDQLCITYTIPRQRVLDHNN